MFDSNLLQIQILLPSTPVQLVKLPWKEATSLFTVMQQVTQHQTSRGQKMAAQQCCIKERRTALLTYRDRLLEITRVQLGMEWVNRKMPRLRLLYIVSCLYRCLSVVAFYLFVCLFCFSCSILCYFPLF